MRKAKHLRKASIGEKLRNQFWILPEKRELRTNYLTRRYLSILLVLCMLLSMAPVSAFAETEGNSSGYEESIGDDDNSNNGDGSDTGNQTDGDTDGSDTGNQTDGDSGGRDTGNQNDGDTEISDTADQNGGDSDEPSNDEAGVLPANEDEEQGEETIEKTTTHTHSVCLGNSYCTETHSGDQVWTAVTELTNNMEAGYYYLTGDVNLTETWKPASGVVLCLNGFSVTYTGGGVIAVDGGYTFTLTDCKNSGKITGAQKGYNGWNGGGVYVGSGATFVMYGGSITGNKSYYGGGVDVGNSATFKMYGGSISDNTSSQNGGGLYVNNSAKFYLYDGTISYNKSQYGAGVSVEENVAFVIYGGSIEHNTSSYWAGGVFAEHRAIVTMTAGTISDNTARYGGGMYLYDGGTLDMQGGSIENNTASYYGGVYVNNCTLKVSGSAKISGNTLTDGTTSNVYLPSGKTVTITGALSESASIGVTLANTTGTVTGGWTDTTGSSSVFFADQTGYKVTQETSTSELSVVEYHYHAVCNGIASCTENHDNVEWTAVSSLDHITKGGYYYLTQNVERSSTWEPADGVVLCLNGFRVIYTGDSDSVISVTGKFTLTDCKTTGTITGGKGSGVYVRAVDDKYDISTTVSTTVVFNLYGGTITDNSAIYGGGVCVYNATFNMYGGSITKNTATSASGGVNLDNAIFNMYGGSIMGNTATERGGGVTNYMSTITLSGDIQITGNTRGNGIASDLDLAVNLAYNSSGGGEKLKVSVGTLASTAKIGVTMQSSGNDGIKPYFGTDYLITTNWKDSGNSIKAFFADDDECDIRVDSDSGELYVRNGHYHSVCAQDTCTYEKNHNSDQQWTAWTSDTTLPGVNDVTTTEPSYYYLTKDVKLNAPWTPGNNVVLCLNGHTISYDGNTSSVISMYAQDTFTLTDCQGKGKVTGSNSYGVGMGGLSTFNMYGGTITGCDGTTSGYSGGVYVTGTFNMYGGSIENNDGYWGGGVYVSDGTFNLYGGTITGNEASQNGGGVYLEYSTFNMYGGEITGNSAKTSGGVYVNNGTLNVSGSAKIFGNTLTDDNKTTSNVYLAEGKTITVSGVLTENASIGVTLEKTTGTITSGWSATNNTDTTVFFSDSEAAKIAHNDDGELSLIERHFHSVCNSTSCTEIYDYMEWTGYDPVDSLPKSHQSVDWTAWTSTNSLPSADDIAAYGTSYFYLTADVTLSSTWEPADGVYLCLNGKTINAGRNGNAISVTGAFTLTDCQDAGTIDGGGDDNRRMGNGAVYVGSDATFTMYGGSITRFRFDNDNNAGYGGVYVDGGAFHLYNGSITGNKADSYYHSNYGGGVYVNSGTFNMSGGTISNNKAYSGYGGGVYVHSGTFTMSGGTISGNYAYNNGGGGVYMNSGTFTMTGGTISGNNASYGGGVFVNNYATFNTENGTISNNTASNDGGGVNVSGKFTMSGGSITGNSAGYGGGVRIANANGTFTMTGGTISQNKATHSTYGYGGGVSLLEGVFTMQGGTISENTATVNGGGVGVEGGTFQVTGSAKITGNTKADNTTVNNVYLKSGQTITISGVLTEKASIGVTLEDTDKTFTTGWTKSGSTKTSVFFSDHLARCAAVDSETGELYLKEHKNHPICGASCSDGKEHESTTWTAWTSATSLPDQEGNYYLMADVTLSSTWVAPSGVVLCLNGFSVTYTGGSVISVGSRVEFTLTDCVTATVDDNGNVTSGGTITGGNADNGGGVYVSGTFTMYGGAIYNNKAGYGGGVYVNGSDATFNLYGGTIAKNTATTGGGGIYTTGATFYFTDGTLIGNKATYGAGIKLDNKSTIYMSGGVITKNEASDNGGGMDLNSSTLYMSGGSIINNKAVNRGGGMDLYNSFNARPTVNLSGKITISGNTSTGWNAEHGASDLALGWDDFWTINIVDKLDPESQIGVTMLKVNSRTDYFTGTGYCFTVGWKKSGLTDSSVFFTDNGGYYLATDSKSGELYQDKHAHHPICGATCSDDEEHQGTTWTAWTSTTSLPTESGNYFLTADVHLTETWTAPSGVVLCLNGKTITGSGSNTVIQVDGGTFTLTDCVTAEVDEDYSVISGGKITGGNAYQGGGVYVKNGGTFNLYNGSITENKGGDGGGAVYVESSGGTFNLYGGYITRNTSGKAVVELGGSANAKGTFNMYGGTISGNEPYGVRLNTVYVTFNLYKGTVTGNKGGGVHVDGSTFIMYDGEITKNGTNRYEGGGVFSENSASITLLGGTISGNTATGRGGGMYVNNGTLTVSGSVNITGNTVGSNGSASNLHLEGSNILIIGEAGLSSSASIGVTLSYGTGTFVSANGADAATVFFSDITGYGVQLTSAGALNIVDNSTHVDADCSDGIHGAEDVTWTGISSLSEIASAGYYCLTADVTLTETWTAVDGAVLCLNGHTITYKGATSGSVITVNDKFTLTDCLGTGKVTGGNGTYGGVYVYSGTFNLCGGIITGNTAIYGGGVFVGGTFNMTGGTITGNSTTKNFSDGGGVTVNMGGTFTMTGGTITGNTSATGGGVHAGYATFKVSGTAKITGNKLTDGTTSNVYLEGTTITVNGELKDGASIGVTLKTGTGVVTATMSTDYSDYFTSDNSSYMALYQNGVVNLVTKHLHPVCGAECEDGTDTHKDIKWIEWTDGENLPSDSGNYYLATNVNLAETWKPAAGTVLCLNGYTVTGVSGQEVIKVTGKDTTFTLTDCKTTGIITGGSPGVRAESGAIFNLYSGTITGNKTNYGGGMQVNQATFNMYGGSITRNTGTVASGGLDVANYATFNMYGGSITNNDARERGGGVTIANNSTITISGKVNISGNTLTGGNTKDNLYLYSGISITVDGKLDQASSIGVTMASTSGTFTKNWSTSGNTLTTVFTSDNEDYQVQTTKDGTELMIHKHSYDTSTGLCSCGYHQHDVDKDGTVETYISVGALTDDMAAGSYVLSGDVTLSSTWTPKNNINLDLNGYSITLADSWDPTTAISVQSNVTLTVYDCNGSGNGCGTIGVGSVDDYMMMVSSGGTITVSGGSLVMYGGTILGQTASVGMGMYYGVSSAVTVSSGTFTLDGGTIQGNSSIGVSVTGGTFNLNSGKITGCAVSAISNWWPSAGGVYVSGGTFNMTGGEITGNSVARNWNASSDVAANGGGVNLVGGTFNMTGGTITGNKAPDGNGGGVYLGGGTFNISGTAKITGNPGSNVYLPSGKTITVGGELKEGAAIGVTMEASTGTFTGGWSSNNSTNSAFTSDSSTYVVLAETISDVTELTLHQHSYSYSGSGDTITATCTTCNDKQTAKLVLDDTVSVTYTGDEIKPVKVETSAGWPSGTLNISYSNNVDAGTNTASAKIAIYGTSSATATLTFSIEKAAIATTYTVSMSGYTYGGTVSEPSLSSTYAGGGTVTYYYNTTHSNENGTEFANVSATSLDAGTYYIYATIAATDNYKAYTTTATEFVVSNADQTAPGASVVTIDYINETISYDSNEYEMNTSKSGSSETVLSSDSIITPGNTYYIRVKAVENYNASDWTTITIASRPEAPDVIAIAESSKDQGNGKITGVDSTMEYKLSTADSWTAINGTELTNLDAGTYQVRYKATNSAFYSATATVTVGQGNTLTVTLDSNGGSEVNNITGLSYNAEAGKLPTTTRTGYTFDGWYHGETQLTATTKITANVTYIAKWTLVAPTVNNEQGYTGTYDGLSHEISVSASHDLGTSGLSCQWQKLSGTAWTDISGATNSTYSVKNVNDTGSYRCVVTYTDGTQAKTTTSEAITVTITKAALTVTANAKTITYGDTPANGGVSYDGFVNNETASVLGGELTYSYSYMQYGTVGDYTITPSGLTSGNYNITFKTGTLTVQPKTITATVSAGNKTYDGTTTATVTASISPDQLVNNDSLSISGLTGTFDTANAGTGKTVTVDTSKAAVNGNDNGNYSISYDTTDVKANITQKGLTIIANAKTIIYGDAPTNDGVTYSGFVNNETASVLGGELTYSYSYMQYGNVGSYTITPSGLTSGNYNITFKTGTLTVQPKTITATVTARNKTYDGTTTATVTASVSTDQLANNDSLSISGLTGMFADANAGTGKTVTVDTSKATVTGNDNGNYSITYATTGVTANITQKDLTITANAKTITYGDAPTNGGVSYDGFVNNETASVLGGTLSYDYDYQQYGKVGDYTITPSGLTSGNYNITFETGTLTVQPKTITATVAARNKTYDGTTTATVSASVSPDQLVNNDSLATSGLTGTFDTANAGTGKTVTVDTSKAAVNGNDNGNYSITYATTDVTANITQKDLTITANAKTITYGDAPTNGGVSYDGFVNNETASVLGGTLSYDYDYQQYGKVGDYTITPSGLTSGNYNITFKTGTLTVQPKTITATVSAGNKTYDGTTTATVTASVSTDQLVNNDQLSISGLTGMFADANAGTGKTVTVDTSKAAVTGNDNGNYTISYDTTDVKANITAKELTPTNMTVKQKEYDGTTTAEISTYALSTGIEGDTLTTGTDFTVSAVFTDKVAGTSSATFTFTLKNTDKAKNYALSSNGSYTVDASIVKKPVDVPTLANLIYTGNKQSAYLEVTQGSLFYVVENVGGIHVAQYSVKLRLNDQNNYEWNIVNGTNVSTDQTLFYNITQATNTWKTAPSISGWTYGDTAKAPSYEATFGNDTVKVEYKANVEGAEYSENVPTNAGSYTVRFTVAATTNYTGLETTASLTIAPKVITASVTVNDKTYDGTNTATVKEVTFKDNAGNAVALTVDDYTASATFDNANAGEQDVTATVTLKDTVTNYTLSSSEYKTSATITAKNISKAEITLGDALTYNGAAQTQEIKGVTVDGLTVTYTVEGEKQTDAGNYTLTITGSGNFTGEATKDWSIAAKALTITADSQTKKYSEADPELTYKVEGLAEGDTISGSLTREAGEQVGTYTITQGTLAASNYTITFTGAELTISKNPGATIATTTEKEDGTTVVTKVNDANQIVETTVTDENGNVVEVVQNEYWEESGNVHVVTVTDGEGNQTETQYADDGKTVTVVTETDVEGNETKTEYAEDGKTVTVVTETDVEGNEIKTEYAEDGKTVTVVTETDAKGNETKTEYASDGKTVTVVTETDATGNVTKTEYQAENTTVVTKYDAEGQQTERKTTYANGSYLLDGFDPELIEGDGSRYDGENPMPFRSNDELINFLYVKLNGEALDVEHYQVSSGSIRVVLNADYLDTLKPGTYTLSIVSTNGEASGTFTIPEKKDPVSLPVEEETKPTETTKPVTTTKPTDTTKIKDTAKSEKTTETVKTGDNSHLEFWMVMFLLSAGGVVGCTTYTRRKREKKSK